MLMITCSAEDIEGLLSTEEIQEFFISGLNFAGLCWNIFFLNIKMDCLGDVLFVCFNQKLKIHIFSVVVAADALQNFICDI